MSTLRYRVISPSGLYIGENFYALNSVLPLTAAGAKYLLLNEQIALAPGQAPSSGNPGDPNEDDVSIDITVGTVTETVSLTKLRELFPSIKGDKGDQGNPGATGSRGQKGDKGDKGDQGRGFELSGVVATFADLPMSTDDGQLWVTIDDGHGWAWFNAAWNDLGQFKGDKGDQGPMGPQGLRGPAGADGQKGDTGFSGNPAYADRAELGATNAAASEAAAAASATTATNNANAAQTYASQAQGYRNDAQTHASNAATSENNALGSKTAAKLSENNAAASEASAAASASTATSAATTAVQAAKGTADPQMDGTAAVGTSTKWAHEDHVHPTDTSRAPKDNPTFTGTATADAFAGSGAQLTGVGLLGGANAWSKQQTSPIQTLATTTWDVSAAQKARITLSGNGTMAAATNVVEGTTYFLWVIQDGTGSRTLSWASSGAGSYDFGTNGAPTLTTTPNKADLICFEAVIIAGVLKLRYAGIQRGFS